MFLEHDELVAIQEGYPLVIGGIMFEAMDVGLELLVTAGIARIGVVDQPMRTVT